MASAALLTDWAGRQKLLFVPSLGTFISALWAALSLKGLCVRSVKLHVALPPFLMRLPRDQGLLPTASLVLWVRLCRPLPWKLCSLQCTAQGHCSIILAASQLLLPPPLQIIWLIFCSFGLYPYTRIFSFFSLLKKMFALPLFLSLLLKVYAHSLHCRVNVM